MNIRGMALFDEEKTRWIQSSRAELPHLSERQRHLVARTSPDLARDLDWLAQEDSDD